MIRLLGDRDMGSWRRSIINSKPRVSEFDCSLDIRIAVSDRINRSGKRSIAQCIGKAVFTHVKGIVGRDLFIRFL